MVKKSFFKVIMIAPVILGAMVLSSCVSDVTTYTQKEVQEAHHATEVEKYEQAFVNLVGQPDSNQSWDFTKGGSYNTMRGASDLNSLSEWPTSSAYLYGFNSKYATGNDDPLPQGTLASTVVKQADQIKEAIEAAVEAKQFKTWAPTGNYVFRTVASFRNSSTNKDKDKYYTIGANFGDKNNFIAMMGVKKNGKAIKNGSAGVQHTCAIVFDNVPTDAVWFAHASTKKDDSFKAVDFPLTDYVEVTYDGRTFWGFKCDADGGYSDLILWVDKANISKELIIAKRYMVEDLGGSGDSDIDFNDIVFDVQQYSDGTQKCIVRALGGTLPIKIKVGKSVWWSKPEPVSKMINTGVDGKAINYDEVIAEFDVTGWVEKDNNVQVSVENKEGYEFVTTFPENGSIPAMIAFSVAKKWNKERVPVSEEWFTTYPFEFNFEDYINE